MKGQSSFTGKIEKNKFDSTLQNCFRYVEVEQDRRLGALDESEQAKNIKREYEKRRKELQKELATLTYNNTDLDLSEERHFTNLGNGMKSGTTLINEDYKRKEEKLMKEIEDISIKLNQRPETIDPHTLLFLSFESLAEERFFFIFFFRFFYIFLRFLL